jgi:probable phosphoglycerate mutase
LQARAAAEALRHSPVRPAAVLSSDLERCRQTAHVVAAALDLPIHWVADLRERSFGTLEGASWRDVPGEDVGIVAGHVAAPEARPPGGESVADLRRRVLRGLRRAGALSAPVLVVTHGGPIRVVTGPAAVRGMPWPPVPHALPRPVCLRALRDPGGSCREARSRPTGEIPSAATSAR